MNKQKGSPRFAVEAGFAPILIIIGIVLLTVVVGGAYYFGTKNGSPLPSITSSTIQPSPV